MKLLIACALLTLSVDLSSGAIVLTAYSPLSGRPGETIPLFADFHNQDSETLFLNGNSISVGATGLAINDYFLTNVPAYLTGYESLTGVHVLDIVIGDPFPAGAGTFSGSYSLFGGVDIEGQDFLAQVPFHLNVQPVPEPGSVILLPICALLLVLKRYQKHCPPERLADTWCGQKPERN